MTPTITTEDREAAEKFCEGFIGHHPMSALDKRSKDGFLSGIIYCRSQPDSEFQKGVASVQSQLTEARERLRVATTALDDVHKHCLCANNVETDGFDYGEKHPRLGIAKAGSRWLTPRELVNVAKIKIAQIQEPNGKKDG